MKTLRTIQYLGAIACVGALTLGPWTALAQEPPPVTKLPPLPKGQPPSDPRLPTDAKPNPKPGGGTGDQDPLKSPAQADTRFAMAAAEGGILEVELGRLAARKAANAEVKEFAERMVTDHTKANIELKSIASDKSIALPTEERVKAKHQAMIATLEKLEGAAFDRAYMAAMVKDHDKVALFEKEAKDGRDAALQAFAEKTLPTIKEHQKMAKQLNIKVSTKGTN